MHVIPLALATVVSLASSAFAQERLSPLPNHMPLRVDACFGRAYDAEHLRQHPKQRVTSFHVFRDFAVDETAEDPPMSTGTVKDVDGEQGIGLSAYVRFRDKPGVYSNWFNCSKNDEGKIRCGIDCDGGSFQLRAAGSALTLENEGFVVVGGCGGTDEELENPEYVRPGADDKLFQLDPKPLAACVAEREAMKPKWAKLGKPIRERLATLDAVCFSRRYDAAHLASHPQQQIKRIAMLKRKGSKPVYEGQQVYELTFRIERKDGKKFVKTTTCQPSKYSYACTQDRKFDVAEDFFLTRAGDGKIGLRDYKGKMSDMFNAILGKDDRSFMLSASPVADCTF